MRPAIASLPGVSLDPESVETNIVIFSVDSLGRRASEHCGGRVSSGEGE
jgi:hypothetical protein